MMKWIIPMEMYSIYRKLKNHLTNDLIRKYPQRRSSAYKCGDGVGDNHFEIWFLPEGTMT